MFQKDYKREVGGLSPSPAATARLDRLLTGETARRPRRHLGRRGLVAAALCAVLTVTAAAAGPAVWDALTAHLGPFAPYLSGGGARSVSAGVELEVAGAISDGVSARVYLTAHDRQGRLDAHTAAKMDLEGATSWGLSALAFDAGRGARLRALEAAGLTDGGALTLSGGTLTPGQYWAARDLDPAAVPTEPLETTETGHGAVLRPDQPGQTFEGLDGLTAVAGFDGDGAFHLRAVLDEGYEMTGPVQVFAIFDDGTACLTEAEDRTHLSDGQDVVLPGLDRENWDRVTRLWFVANYQSLTEPIEGDWTLSLTAREAAGLSTPAGFTLDAPGGATVTGVSLSPLGVVVEYTGDPESVQADGVAVALAHGSAPAWETGRAACSGWNWGGKGYLVCRFAAPAEPVGAAVTLFGQPVPLS